MRPVKAVVGVKAYSPDGYYREGPYYQRYAMYPFLIFALAMDNVKPELKVFGQMPRPSHFSKTLLTLAMVPTVLKVVWLCCAMAKKT